MRDGDDYTAASLKADINAIRDTMSDLPTSAVEPGALRLDHLPSIWAGDLFPSGYSAGYALNTSYEDYRLLLRGGLTITPDLQTFSGSIHNVSAPYGPLSSGTPSTATGGWVIPAYQGVLARAAEVSTSTFDMDAERIRGVFCHGTLELGMAQGHDQTDSVLLAIGWRDGAGALHVAEDSIVAYGKDANAFGALSVGWFLTQDDLDAGDGQVQDIVLCLSAGKVVAGSAASLVNQTIDATASVTFEVGSYWLSCLPFHAGALS